MLHVFVTSQRGNGRLPPTSLRVGRNRPDQTLRVVFKCATTSTQPLAAAPRCEPSSCDRSLDDLSSPRARALLDMTVEAFSAELGALSSGGRSAAELNGLYWRDTLATIEAYTMMAVWRIVDISKAAFALVESDAYVPASILATSALESRIRHPVRSRCSDDGVQPGRGH